MSKINLINKEHKILIVGLGLLGGSYAQGLTDVGFDVSAIDIEQESIDYAIEKGYIKDGQVAVTKEYVSQFDIVIFALYPKVFVKWLKDYQDFLKKGAIITDVTGLHSGANSITGDFSLAAKGFYIENGIKSKPVEQITVAGNFFTLLNDIEEIGSDLKFPMSSVGSPSVLVKELSIAGEGAKNE